MTTTPRKHRSRTTNPAGTARRIQRLSRALCMTLRELAPLFGVTHQSVKWWSSGRFAPNLRHQFMLDQLERRNADKLAALDARAEAESEYTTPNTGKQGAA